MARPPLPVGTAGNIRVYKTATGYRVRCKFRDYDGQIRELQRHGSSMEQAKNRLREAVRDRTFVSREATIQPDTKLSVLAEVWYEELSGMNRSPSTLEVYRGKLDGLVIPGVGGLRVREAANVSHLDRFVKSVLTHQGPGAAKTTRTVLSGMLGLAVRRGALIQNPVRDIGNIEVEKEPAQALTLEQASDLSVKIAVNPRAIELDLVDFTDMMLATGLRIGETAAITWDAIDLDAGTVEVRGTVIRIKGTGLVLQMRPKSRNGYRTLELPSWALAMLKRRHQSERLTTERKVHVLLRRTMSLEAVRLAFPAPLGSLRDRSNTQRDLRGIFDAAGYDWVSSHVYRKTVATLMDEAGLSARAAADQLGHAKVSMTQDVYMGRRRIVTEGAAVLEGIRATKDGE